MNGELLLQEAQGHEQELVEKRHYLHRHAELGFDLKETVAFVKAELTAMGYEPKDCGKAGVVVTAGGKKPGKVFLIRSDMDALPMHEESGVDFASETENMHACGHDMHATMMLGAAKLLKAHEDEIEGTVKLMFQPAEEISAGSHDMIQAGVLENPHVDAALMIHVMAGMPFEPGSVIVSEKGVSAPAADYFEIKVKGVGCHGSMPNTGVDPINIAAHIHLALQTITSREIKSSEAVTLTIGKFIAGNSSNAIPDSALMEGSIRAHKEEILDKIIKRIGEISTNIAKSFNGDATLTITSRCKVLKNNNELSEVLYISNKQIQEIFI